ncbi:MAG: hypothetical protein H0W61_08470 [Bacteroidetes bacterium]|nr:hypothetical protein [Bacteroidota bacterium]
MLAIDELIARFVSGNVTESECIELEAWRKKAENEKIFSVYEASWNLTRKAKKTIPVDADEAWERFSEKDRQVLLIPAKKSDTVDKRRN